MTYFVMPLRKLRMVFSLSVLITLLKLSTKFEELSRDTVDLSNKYLA